MSAMFRFQARYLNKMINANNETLAHVYFEQLLLFPVDIQDKIIEEISQLSHCSNDAVANIISRYSVIDP